MSGLTELNCTEPGFHQLTSIAPPLLAGEFVSPQPTDTGEPELCKDEATWKRIKNYIYTEIFYNLYASSK